MEKQTVAIKWSKHHTSTHTCTWVYPKMTQNCTSWHLHETVLKLLKDKSRERECVHVTGEHQYACPTRIFSPERSSLLTLFYPFIFAFVRLFGVEITSDQVKQSKTNILRTASLFNWMQRVRKNWHEFHIRCHQTHSHAIPLWSVCAQMNVHRTEIIPCWVNASLLCKSRNAQRKVKEPTEWKQITNYECKETPKEKKPENITNELFAWLFAFSVSGLWMMLYFCFVEIVL